MVAAKKLEIMPEEQYIQDALKSGRATIQEVSMKALGTPDVAYQARVQHLDMDHVHRLSTLIDQGEKLHPVVVFRSPKRWILADGFHRHEAYRRKRLLSIRAYVVEVADDAIEHEARLYASMCNRLATLARKKEDIKKAVEILFADPECWRWDDTRIAQHCGSTQSTIKTHRYSFASSNGKDIPETVKLRDGTVMKYERGSRMSADPKRINIEKGFKGKPTYVARVGGKKIILGNDPDSAKRELESILSNKLSLKVHAFGLHLNRKGVFVQPPKVASMQYPSITGLVKSGVVLTTIRFNDGETVPLAVGRLLLLRLLVGKPSDRMIAACYPEDGPRDSIDLARELGIEFLTPEELVASLKGQGDAPAPSADAESPTP